MTFVLNNVVTPQLDAARLGSTFTRINVDAIKNLRIPVPPVQEQRALAAECDREVEATSAVRRHLRRLADLIDERRRALITACVTGEFDVSTASSRAGDAALQGIK